ncbi:hypothetical protein LXL04_002463 [Taraxacum kok-saghyz]
MVQASSSSFFFHSNKSTSMAMECVPLIIGTIFEITKMIFKSTSNSDLGESMASMTRALQELTEARKDLETQVEQSQLLGHPPTNQIKGWLERVASVEAEVGMIIEDIESVKQRNCYCCCNCNCGLRFKLSKMVRQKLMMINDLKEKNLNLNGANGGLIPPDMEVVPSGPTIGLDVMLERVHELLMEHDVATLGIYGMGGVGKTTLLKRINNELPQKLEFDVVIWAVASKDFVVEKIQQAIVARLGLSWDDNDTQEQRANRFPDKNNKCNVVFTTRSMDVCCDMDADSKIKIEFLKEGEAWSLFCQKVGRNDILSSQPIRSYADTIVRKCGGLPLALVTMGRVMANKETEEEWQYAIQVLNETPTELRGMEDVFTLLKFSYQNLGSDTLRLCFVYCTLFPEDYSIEFEQLIEYWIAEGFLANSDGSKARNMGHTIIRSLIVACLLETGEIETQVKMHDVVRSFALWMASECGKNRRKYLVQPSAGLTKAPDSEYWENAERISLWDNAITELPENLYCPHLLTLLLQWNSGLSRISNGFFQFMPSLQVLDLSFTSLKEIPASICELTELRYLDLSRTKLTTLPKQLGKLQKLRHLDLHRVYLRTIPCEAINRLSQVRLLNLYYSYGSWEMQDSEYENEVSFSDLECLTHLETLGITITESHTLKRLARSKTLLICIHYLYITECEGLVVLPLSTIPDDGKRFRRLSVNNCRDLMYLETGIENGKNWLPSLEVLALYRLPSLTIVWKNPVTKGSLQNLRSVNIWYCDKLKNISWIFQLPKLEMVYLFYCKEIEEVISRDAEGVGFPCLRAISIRDLPSLTDIAHQPIDFPCLQSIAVINCPKLRKLPIKVSGNSTLPTVYGDREWWNRLEWDAADSRSAFVSHFMAT